MGGWGNKKFMMNRELNMAEEAIPILNMTILILIVILILVTTRPKRDMHTHMSQRGDRLPNIIVTKGK